MALRHKRIRTARRKALFPANPRNSEGVRYSSQRLLLFVTNTCCLLVTMFLIFGVSPSHNKTS
jgi:hypothetical protein